MKAYSAFAQHYTNSISDVTPPEYFDFIKLIPQGGEVLDIGCAGGRDEKFLIENGFVPTGIDLSQEMLTIAKQAVPAARFLLMDALTLQFSEQSFDAVLASAVLLHLSRSDVPLAIQQIRLVLKPYGYLFIGVKEGIGEKHVIDKLSFGHTRLFTFFEQSEIESLIEKAGFKIKLSKRCTDEVGRDDVSWIRIIAQKLN